MTDARILNVTFKLSVGSKKQSCTKKIGFLKKNIEIGSVEDIKTVV